MTYFHHPSVYLRIQSDSSEVSLIVGGMVVKQANLKDRVEKKLFIIDAIALGAQKSRLANALEISRQSIDNYLEIKEYFGLEGIIRGYSLEKTKDIRKHRKKHMENSDFVPCRDAIKQISEIKHEKKRKKEAAKKAQNPELPFTYGGNANAQPVEAKELPFADEHEWKESRYAGTFIYLITLVSQWKWIELVLRYFGNNYRIFMVFLLMAAQNIRSIEQ
ncbi:MAG: hypothetical protein JJV91_00015, partial [Desulfosarcina sp.]|nr:hypothetical protein [Desulfobacterales bacterium]